MSDEISCVKMDSALVLDEQVSSVVRAAFYQLGTEI